MSEGPTPEHPMLFFTPTRGGYRVALDADRSVQLSLGQDDAGVTRWSLRTENCGHVITFCLSDEAMDAILRTHAIEPSLLRADEFDEFYQARKAALLRLIEQAMRKAAVMTGEEPIEDEDIED